MDNFRKNRKGVSEELEKLVIYYIWIRRVKQGGKTLKMKCLKFYQVSHNVIKFNMKSINKWKVELTART